MVATLVRFGANLEITRIGAGTALMMAAGRGQESMVAALLKAGADRGARGPDGLSAVDVAKKFGHAGIIALLSA